LKAFNMRAILFVGAAVGTIVLACTSVLAESSSLNTQISAFLKSFRLESPPTLIRESVPEVGCPQDGQAGPVPAPQLTKAVAVTILADAADQLAYYTAKEGNNGGILAPRGWSCFGTYGSSGSSLYVTPAPIPGPILDKPKRLGPGQFVELQEFNGDTSGRFPMAKIVGRVFPSARPFAENVRSENIDQDDYFTLSPTDILQILAPTTASYVTPQNYQGIGTMFGVSPGNDPIHGLIFMDLGDQTVEPFLSKIDVRLSDTKAPLYASIAINQITASTLSKQASPPLNEQPADLIGTVSTFYEALGRADGEAAAAQVVPEKRTRGPFSAQEITRFYSGLSQRLTLDSVSKQNDNSVRVRYRYRTTNGALCNGEALVALRVAGSHSLIESIRALNKC
jgi:hypothetical protein